MTIKQLEEYILSKPGAKLDYPFGPETAVYKVADKMFALIPHKKQLQINLKCDPNLSQLLRDRYESVMPGYHMNKRHWNTIVLSGQLEDREVFDLVDHSYQLVVAGLSNEQKTKLSAND